MSSELETHRGKEFLGGVVNLLTIDMSAITGDPLHVLRYVNNYGKSGTGVAYQGHRYKPYPYEIATIKRSSKATKSGTKVAISDIDANQITNFISKVGGDIRGARILELRVYGRFLDGEVSANQLAYSKRLDHVVSYVEDSSKRGEILIHTTDPLSKDVTVPSISFSAGVANSKTSAINIFPAVDRRITKDR